jgi:c-di-GMP-binding flagellar brake protein YcgR
MTESGDFYTRIDHPAEIIELLETLRQPGTACVVLEQDQMAKLPVTVAMTCAGEVLHLDVSAIADGATAFCEGAVFRLNGQGSRGVLRTPILTVQQIWEEDQRRFCKCEFPSWLEKHQQRDTFRARLRRGMKVKVNLQDAGATATGYLRDLSLHGCMVEAEPSAAALLEDRSRPLQLEMNFPDGTRFIAPGWPRHQTFRNDRILCGFRLEVAGRDQQQRLWFLVRETERESARHAASDKSDLRPSPLYAGSTIDDAADDSDTYRNPMARQLAGCASFLATQIMKLRQGGLVDQKLLSQHAAKLMALHAEDREGLLFALTCLHRELPLIRHCLAVAVRLVDLGAALGLKPDVCRALAAAGLVHDLGKALLPAPLRDATHLDAEQQRQFRQHVALIKDRLAACHWLSPVAVQTVVEGGNERLDGSGYPGHRSGDKLHALMRVAAIVDVVDAMGRDRADRAGLPIDRIYQHLRRSPAQFDPRWVERYVDHFGIWPVGTLLRFPRGELGWVLSLDAERAIAAVRQVDEPSFDDATSGILVHGRDLARLGTPVEALLPSA